MYYHAVYNLVVQFGPILSCFITQSLEIIEQIVFIVTAMLLILLNITITYYIYVHTLHYIDNACIKIDFAVYFVTLLMPILFKPGRPNLFPPMKENSYRYKFTVHADRSNSNIFPDEIIFLLEP